MIAATALGLVGLLGTATAQKFTDCDPTSTDCEPVPAIGRYVECDFTRGPCDLFRELDNGDGPAIEYDDENGALFVIEKELDAPTLRSNQFIFFGRIEAELQAAPGQGLVTSLIMTSQSLDEVEISWVGKRGNQVETNYFAKGDASTGNRSGEHPVSNATGDFHTYVVEWTPQSISWSVDGDVFRVEGRKPSDKGETYPQTPADIRVGSWVAGRSNADEGTIRYAGGVIDESDGPFTFYLRSIKITDYAGGDEMPETRAVEYESISRNGTYQSIQVNTSGEDDDPPAGERTSSTSSPKSSPTGSPENIGSEEEEEPSDGSSSSDVGLPIGAIAGIAVGSVAVLAATMAGFFFWRRRKRLSAHKGASIAELQDHNYNGWKQAHYPPVEMHGTSQPQELDSRKVPAPVELAVEPIHR